MTELSSNLHTGIERPVRILIFAKAPLPGLAKTRLIPALGEEGASGLAARLLEHTVAQAVLADIGPVELWVSPTRQLPVWEELSLSSSLEWFEQGSGSLGERMARASRRASDMGASMLLIGTDCPEVTADLLRTAAAELRRHDALVAPVSDGGYALLGLRRYLAAVFSDMPWSTSRVARLTQQRIRGAGWTLGRLATLHDIDEPQDLQYLPRGWRQRPSSMPQRGEYCVRGESIKQRVT